MRERELREYQKNQTKEKWELVRSILAVDFQWARTECQMRYYHHCYKHPLPKTRNTAIYKISTFPLQYFSLKKFPIFIHKCINLKASAKSREIIAGDRNLYMYEGTCTYSCNSESLPLWVWARTRETRQNTCKDNSL